MKKLGNYKFLLALVPMIAFSIGISLIGADAIVEYIGMENTYIAMFLIAFVGGLSIFAGIPYPLILLTLALGGSNIIYLCIATSLGVMLGDSSSYIVGYKAKTMFKQESNKIFKKILSVYDTYPKYIMGFIFLYGISSPFPNDMITLSAGLKRYSYRKMIIPLTAGNFIFCLIITSFAEYFVQYF